MLDFDSELKKILTEDPLGILKTRTIQPITSNQRLNDSFEEINDFIEELGIDILAMVKYKHSFIEAIIKEPVIKKLGFQSKIPFLVIPE